MATVVWQGFQYSCSDAEQLLPPPVTSLLRLKLSPQKHSDHLLGGCTFLQSLSVVNSDVTLQKPSIDAETYFKDGFAPLTPSLLKLSEKSLEMCTETLGSETGSDVITNDADIYPSSFIMSTSQSPTISKTRQQSLGVKKVNSTGRSSSSSFPPPLTTRRGGGERVLLVRSHREEGRLVMDAVKCPSSRSNFITDRSHGRLRLTLLRPVLDSDVVVGKQPINTDTTTTTVINNENEFRQGNYKESGESSSSLDIIGENYENHIIISRDEDEGEKVSESTGRFQKQLLPAISRCMQLGEHHQLYHHHTRQLINVRLWMATS